MHKGDEVLGICLPARVFPSGLLVFRFHPLVIPSFSKSGSWAVGKLMSRTTFVELLPAPCTRLRLQDE